MSFSVGDEVYIDLELCPNGFKINDMMKEEVETGKPFTIVSTDNFFASVRLQGTDIPDELCFTYPVEMLLLV